MNDHETRLFNTEFSEALTPPAGPSALQEFKELRLQCASLLETVQVTLAAVNSILTQCQSLVKQANEQAAESSRRIQLLEDRVIRLEEQLIQ